MSAHRSQIAGLTLFSLSGLIFLVTALRADDAWTARLDGVVIAGGTDEQGRQVFAVPESGTLDIQYEDRPYRVWFWASLVAVCWAIVAAIPVRGQQLVAAGGIGAGAAQLMAFYRPS